MLEYPISFKKLSYFFPPKMKQLKHIVENMRPNLSQAERQRHATRKKIMNPLGSIANLFRGKRKQQDAVQLGREFGEALLKRIEAIPTDRFDEFAIDLLSAFKNRLGKISEDSSDDPILIATAELKIVDKEVENYQQTITQDILNTSKAILKLPTD
jgi:hypothetical protein